MTLRQAATEKSQVVLQALRGKQILGTARRHTVVMDRKISDGGQDTGFTSGELLLLAIGSCATAGVRRCVQSSGLDPEGLRLEVGYADDPDGGFDRIEIRIELPADADPGLIPHIRRAAVSGGVTRRMNAASALHIAVAIG